MSEITGFACQHPSCTASGVAEKMWNFRANGQRVVVCPRHGHEGRKRGLRVYRLSATLEYEQKIAREREESEAFFARYQARNATRSKVTLGKALGRKTVKAVRQKVAAT